jgi:ATP citrate (pro-S)-lyase
MSNSNSNSDIVSEYSIKNLFMGSANCWKINKKNFNKSDYDAGNKKYIIKVDCGIKSRKKSGLIKIGNMDDIENFILSVPYEDFIMEPFYNIIREDYVMFRYSEIDLIDEIYYGYNIGGVEFNDLSKCKKINVAITDDFISENEFYDKKIYEIIKKLFLFYRKYHFTFLEINPLGLMNTQPDSKFAGNSDNLNSTFSDIFTQEYIPLDFAGKIDNDSLFLFSNDEQKLLSNRKKDLESEYIIDIEKDIQELDEKSGASLKFKLLNKNGSIWTMVAGGGASVLYTDCITNMGLLNELANYGEYSGNPTENELYSYSKLIISQMLKSKSKNKPYLILGGGISNFTYIDATFRGIAKTINEYSKELCDFKVCILVRRGGLNYKEGLKIIDDICKKNKIECFTYGYDTHITSFLLNHIKTPNNIDSDQNCINEQNIVLNFEENLQIENICNCLKKNKKTPLSFGLDGKIIVMNLQKDVVQRILDYDYMSGLNEPSVACLYYIGDTNQINVFWGDKEITLPVYSNIDDIINNNLNITIALNYYSFRSAFETTSNIMKIPTIKTIAVIAEGVPIRQAKTLKALAESRNICILGCSTVGAIFPERRRFGNAMGSIEHIKNISLYQKGSVGLVTKSGGLMNEMANMINLNSNGIHSAISVGGDRYPCTSLLDIVLMYENDAEIELIVILGEVGSIQELEIGFAKKNGLIQKPIMCWCSGTSLDIINKKTPIKFGHAGSYIEQKYESSIFKNNYLRLCGVIVPDTFEEYENMFKIIATKRSINERSKRIQPKDIPLDFTDLIKNKKIRINSLFTSSISNERKELMYNNKNILSYVENNNKIGSTIGALLFKKDLPDYLSKFIEICITLLADHGIAVSSSHNTAVAARAGQNISAAVASGILTIHDKHGGAMQECANEFFNAKYKKNFTAEIFVKEMKKNGKNIPGIGHAFKNSKTNKDARLTILFDYIKNNFLNYDLVEYAKEVENITLKKKDNLILNVDGMIATALISAFLHEYGLKFVENIIELKGLNAIFIIARTIGLCGTFIDQNRNNNGLYRQPDWSINYCE